MIYLAINIIISSKLESGYKRERLLWIDEGGVIGYFIDIDDKKALPIKRLISNIIIELKEGLLFIDDNDPHQSFIREDDITNSYKNIRNKAWEYISFLTHEDKMPAIFDSLKRGELISEILVKYPVNKRDIYKNLRRYWQRGQTINCLLPDYFNSGGKGKPRKEGGKKVGKKRKNAAVIGEGCIITEDIKRIFRIAVTKYYNAIDKNSLRYTFDQMTKEFFWKEELEDINGVRKVVLKEQDERPNIRQFRYWFNKENNHVITMIEREGEKRFNKDLRPILGSATNNNLGPGYEYQIDATVADVYLTSRYNKQWIIGRPVLYFVTDSFSRLINGLYIGLEGPSYLGAMMALMNVAEDKVKFCKEYGIDIRKKEWDTTYMPTSILADRGELISDNVKNMISGLKIRVSNTPPFRPDWKPIVESKFKVIQDKVKPFLPGYVMKDFGERGTRDYRLDALFDIYDFTKIIIKTVIHYNNSRLNSYQRSNDMIEANIEPIPSEIWKWGITNHSGCLRTFKEDIVKLNLMPSDSATVTRKGIKFKSMFYSCDLALRNSWFILANKKTWSIPISYDPRNMNHIYIRHEDGKNYEICTLLTHQMTYKDKTFEEIMYLQEYEVLQEQISEQQELQYKLDTYSEIEHILEEAKKEKGSRKLTSKDIKGIKEKRKIEREELRIEQAFSIEKNSKENTVYENTNNEELEERTGDEDIYNILSKIQQSDL